mmetsp:Transcript_19478/g.27852  ORF Transcript_19478/g.27852 Transcript_19478/m.27852 type:complete len:204 (-) Transcript_19478:41-652(-)
MNKVYEESESNNSRKKLSRSWISSCYQYCTPLDLNDLGDSLSKRHKTENLSDCVVEKMKIEDDVDYVRETFNSEFSNTIMNQTTLLESNLISNTIETKQSLFLSWKPQKKDTGGVQDALTTSKILYLCGCCNQPIQGDELDLGMSCTFCCKKLCFPNSEIHSSKIEYCYRKCELCSCTYCKYCVLIDYSRTFERVLCFDCHVS